MTSSETSPTPAPFRYDETGRAPREHADTARADGAVQRQVDGSWVVLGHDAAVRVAQDATTFSSAVSRFLQVPNGLDGREHAAVREALDPFFTAERMEVLEPRVRGVARDLARGLMEAGEQDVEVVGRYGDPFAIRAMLAWLGWPAELEDRLLAWMEENRRATRSGDLARTTQVAQEYDAIIEVVLAAQDVEPTPDAPQERPTSVTQELARVRVHTPEDPDGRTLSHRELVSVLRNFTAGDLGSVSLSLGVALAGLTRHPELAARVRAGADPAETERIIDEFLRQDDPFVSNRRVATCPVELEGHRLEAGDRVRVHWTAANRDPARFADPDAIEPQDHAQDNLVWGTGPHVCPGRPLAMMELRVAVEEFLAAADLHDVVDAERTVSPLGGNSALTLRLRAADRA